MSEPRHPRKRNRLYGCLALAVGPPLACLLVIILIFSVNNRPPVITVPTPPPLPVNAYSDFVRAGQLASARRTRFPNSMPGPLPRPYTLADYAAATREAEPIQAVVRRGFGKPFQAPPVRSAGGTATGFPVFSTLRETARMLAGMSEYYAQIGQYERAVQARLDAVEMGVMLANGGPIINGLVGVACEAIGLAGLEPLLPRLSKAEMARVAARLDRIAAKRAAYADILLEEDNVSTAMWLESFRDPKLNHLSLDYFKSLRDMLGTGAGGTVTFSEAWELARFALANKTAMLQANRDYHRALAGEARKPYTGKSAVPVPNNPLAQIESGIYVSARRSFVAMEAAGAVLRAEVALYRYRQDHGRFPDRLDALVPAYLPVVPDDPCGGGAGRPLRYRATNGGQGFLLYSLGADLQDDGGQSKRFPNDQNPGDIVARRLWQPRGRR